MAYAYVPLPEPDFIGRDPATITAELVAAYEAPVEDGGAGKPLYPAQVEALLINLISYRETGVRVGIQETGKQNLARFAMEPMLDYLAELVDTYRLPPKAATVTLRFSIPTALATDLAITTSMAIQTNPAGAIFAPDADTLLLAGQTHVDVAATCTTTGTIGNGWQLGQISQPVADLGNDLTATNITIPSGGAEREDTEHLREAVYLAPGKFSTCGSEDGYIYWAMRAHASVIDVKVPEVLDGQVKVYVLTKTGLPSPEILALVQSELRPKDRRPISDTPTALAPSLMEYSIEAVLTPYIGADTAAMLADATQAAEEYAAERAAGLGRDVVRSQVTKLLSVAGVYDLELPEPAASLIVADHAWANCTAINITIGPPHAG